MSLLSMFLACGSSEAPPGQVVFSSTGATSTVTAWVVPSGVTAIHAVVVGGGPGNAESSIKRGAAVLIDQASTIGADFGGGDGGTGTQGGGGAGGYSGSGGAGASTVWGEGYPGAAGSGGGGGGGASGDDARGYSPRMGGGVGLQGQGASGAGGYFDNFNNGPGGDGSATGAVFGAGGIGYKGGNLRYTTTQIAVTPGETLTITTAARSGGIAKTSGAVRIMWGAGRSYPSNAADV